MLQIDINGSKHVQSQSIDKPKSNPIGLNSYQSLNRALRIKEIARVADDNKTILNRLQSTKSHFSADKWKQDFTVNRKNLQNLGHNSDRY